MVNLFDPNNGKRQRITWNYVYKIYILPNAAAAFPGKISFGRVTLTDTCDDAGWF